MATFTLARSLWIARTGLAGWLLLALGPAAFGDDSPLRAVITELKNKVDRRASERSQWYGARVQDILLVDNAVRTNANAVAQLTYGDGALMRIAPNTTMVIRQQEARIFNILLGKIWMRLNKGNAPTKLKTPSAIATVIGTTVYVEVAPVGARPGSGSQPGPVSLRDPGRLLALAPELLAAGVYAAEAGGGGTQTTFVVLDSDGNHSLEVQSLDPLTGQPLGDSVTLTNSTGVTIQPGESAPDPRPVNVGDFVDQSNDNGFIPEGQQTGGPMFDPASDVPQLPSEELDRTGSDVSGRVNVILEHDGPPR